MPPSIPDSIPFSAIDLGDRGRTEYNGIEALAQSIQDHGLIQPIVVSPRIINIAPRDVDGDAMGLDLQVRYALIAGGRRTHALKLLGITTLYHATTSDPLRPGFIFTGELEPLSRVLCEIAENLDRENLPWRDEMALIVRAYRMAKRDANSRGEEILLRDFGATIGVQYGDLRAAVAIHDDVVACPDDYKSVEYIRGAYQVLLKKNTTEATKLLALRSISTAPLGGRPAPVQVQGEPKLDALNELLAEASVVTAPTHHLHLSSSFLNCNGIGYMERVPRESFDHIITDPDYGVSIEALNANMGSAASGVAQSSVDASLCDMARMIPLAFSSLRPQGFFIFFYDLDHHEKLQRMCTDAGFAVQRWPLVWHKTDYRSNAAPSYNFCKNIEYAMVCRKQGAVLAKPQMSSVISLPTGDITRVMGHPFAKPLDLWKWIYSAVCIKGQKVYDPCAGRGSSTIAAIQWGLHPVACEINPDHYYGLLLNVQEQYKKLLGPNISFE